MKHKGCIFCGITFCPTQEYCVTDGVNIAHIVNSEREWQSFENVIQVHTVHNLTAGSRK